MTHLNLRNDLFLTEIQIQVLTNTFEVVQILTRKDGVSLFLLRRGAVPNGVAASVVVAKWLDCRVSVTWANWFGYHALGFSAEEVGIGRPMDVEANP